MVRHLALMNIMHVLMLFLYYKAAIDIVGIPDKILGLEIVMVRTSLNTLYSFFPGMW